MVDLEHNTGEGVGGLRDLKPHFKVALTLLTQGHVYPLCLPSPSLVYSLHSEK